MQFRIGLWLAAVSLCVCGAVFAEPVELELPDTYLRYDIEVSLDPDSRGLSGRERIAWTNPLDQAVEAVPMHLYLNGFAHEDTSWIRSSSQGVSALSDPRSDEAYGWSEPTRIEQQLDGGWQTVPWKPISPDDGNPYDRSLIELTLPRPVAPGETLVLRLDWQSRLPIPIARTGGYDGFFFVAQWFPKIAGLHPGAEGEPERFSRHQFHGQTEFFADFADFDVRIGVPSGWALIATGKEGEVVDDGLLPFDSEAHAPDLDWHRFGQRAVHDFAWVTGSRVSVETTTHRTPRDREIEIHLMVPHGTEHQRPRLRAAITGSIDVMDRRVANYPYETLSVVTVPWNASETGGMEYPTLFAGGTGDVRDDVQPRGSTHALESVIVHEYVHQYFYGIVATHEMQEAFLDEGLTSFWEDEIMLELHGLEAGAGRMFGRPMHLVDRERRRLTGLRNAPAIRFGPSFLLRGSSRGPHFYTRPSFSLRTAQGYFGAETVDRWTREFVRRYAFAHPTWDDLLDVAAETGGQGFRALLAECFAQPGLPDYRVDWVDSRRFRTVEGQLLAPDASEVEPDGLDPAAREGDGRVTVTVVDPGYVRDGRRIDGAIRRVGIQPGTVEPDEGWEREDGEYFTSRARVEGPGWDHLPVEVRFVFRDGAVVSDSWDGRAPYREYRFQRPAPLREVLIDPAGRVALDPDVSDNGIRLTAEKEQARDWAWWIGAMFQALAGGASRWL
ncbi:hypothetical protein ABI59_13490 [Acidobacteria bacterium Mor1]|nr:hypothetical protein ABI59_13490 [Acidobacteria bacterium Mor1]